MTKQTDVIQQIQASKYFKDPKQFEDFCRFFEKMDAYSVQTHYGETLKPEARADKEFMAIYQGKKSLFIINPIAWYGVEISQSTEKTTPHVFSIQFKATQESDEETKSEGNNRTYEFSVTDDGALIFKDKGALASLHTRQQELAQFLAALRPRATTDKTVAPADGAVSSVVAAVTSLRLSG